MPTDNTGHLRRAAQHRAETALQQVRAQLRKLDSTGEPVSVAAVARASGVSRTYLYSRPDLLKTIRVLADARGNRPDNVPRVQRATETSLLRRLDALTDKNRRLREEGSLLRKQLSVAHSDLRELRIVTAHRREPGNVGTR